MDLGLARRTTQMAKVKVRCINCYQTFEADTTSTIGSIVGGTLGAIGGFLLFGPLGAAGGGGVGKHLGDKSSCECPYCGAENRIE